MKKLIWRNPEQVRNTIYDDKNLFEKLYVDENGNYTVVKHGNDRFGNTTETEKKINLTDEVYLSVEDLLDSYKGKDEDTMKLYNKLFGGKNER